MRSEERRRYDREWHAANKDRRRETVQANRKRRRLENIAKVNELKESSGCQDCGEKDPIVLEFDHLEDKVSDVCTLVYHGWSWERVWKEIQKCDVVCANCHRRRTHARKREEVLR